jgi:hypothetical protein
MKKYLITIIVLLVLILIFLIFGKIKDNTDKIPKNIELFTNNDDNSIEKPIDDLYLPSINDKNNNDKDYKILNMYKTILNRQPTPEEFRKSRKLSEAQLKTNLLNTPEYNHMIKMQNNDVEGGLEGALAKEDMISLIIRIYKEERDSKIPNKIVLPLRDCFIYLQYNEYLLRALLNHNNYQLFENDIINSVSLSKEKLYELFHKYFDLLELKLMANDIIKHRKLNSRDYDSDNVPDSLTVNKGSNLEDDDNTSKLDEQLNNINKESDEIFNKDKHASSLDNQKRIDELLKKNKNSEVFVRIYDPIDYKNEYRGPKEFRPSVCTNLGQKQLVQPLFLDSKLLMQGTDLDQAFKDTQVGSIMPKFIYREYEDVKIN